MKQMVADIKAKTDVQVVVFGTLASYLLNDMQATGADEVGIDWKTDLMLLGKK